MDITAKLGELIDKLKADGNLKDKFLKDPAGTFKSVTGMELPADSVDNVVKTVKTKLAADNFSEVAGKVGGLFGKK